MLVCWTTLVTILSSFSSSLSGICTYNQLLPAQEAIKGLKKMNSERHTWCVEDDNYEEGACWKDMA